MLWVAPLDEFRCADYGLLALDRIGEHSFLGLLVAVGVFVAIDRLIASLALLPCARRRSVGMRIYPTYVPPDVLVLLWNVFTALSIILVATTARSTLAIAFKTMHIVVEASFLVWILWLHQLRGLATLATAAVGTITLVVLLYGCEESIGWAEIGGLVLDSVNFIMHCFVLCRQPANRELRLVTLGFGFHAAYLLLYLVINDLHRFVPLHLSDDVRATLRVLSMLLNLLAIQTFLRLERRRLLAPAGAMTLGEWNRTCGGAPRALWTSSQSVLLGDDSGEMVALHRPLETAYVEGAQPPLSLPGETARLVEGEVVVHSWTGRRRLTLAVGSPDEAVLVTVRSPFWRDTWGIVVAVAAGTVLWVLR